ncbi:DUF1269 domain-containing protein [Streptomyces sp. NPDC018019]|uniref:DUF1269 domain-containing protein n=1 Tax=Streptomyces sp. NPDC018019 TaxID=3365030 RepID=UPI00379B9FB7
MEDNVLFMDLTSAGENAGRRALDALRHEDAEHRIVLREATVIARGADGGVSFPDSEDRTGTARGFAVGGLVGGLVGLLGGPLGALAGFGAGGLIGGAHDARRASADNAAVDLLAAEVPPGSTVLVAEVAEPARGPVDAALADFGERVVRYPAAEVRKQVEELIAEEG